MSILVAIVSHPHANSTTRSSYIGPFGFHALKPAIDVQPQFLEMLVSRLASADHALCANSLQLINSLMRDAITNDADYEWPKFIQALQGLGVIKAIFVQFSCSISRALQITDRRSGSHAKCNSSRPSAPTAGVSGLNKATSAAVERCGS